MKIIKIASDHAGWESKNQMAAYLKNSYKVEDFGPQTDQRCDYPDYADRLCHDFNDSNGEFGILICGSGQGMMMRANKYRHIRAALCWNEDSVLLAREHNNANILCLGSRFLTHDVQKTLVDIFLKTAFCQGRHTQRVAKISNPLLSPNQS